MSSAVERLESEFAARYCVAGTVATGFGRSALHLALEAVGVRGGGVLLPDFVCSQVIEAARHAGGVPEFFPVNTGLQVEPSAFAASITPTTRAAVVVHYFGRPLSGIEALAEICKERRIVLIEDHALTLGSSGIEIRGDAAIFSFTKNDWCYGGGLLTARSQEFAERARAIRQSSFIAVPGLLRRYGFLRRADFAANRPTRSRAAEVIGRALESFWGFQRNGFYAVGKYDARLPEFAAHRARRILAALPEATARRHAIVAEIQKSLGPARGVLFHAQEDAHDSCAFLLLRCAEGHAHDWRAQAERHGITLRLSWPAYQDYESRQDSDAVRWLAERLLILEIHPSLTGKEVQRLVRCLQLLTASTA